MTKRREVVAGGLGLVGVLAGCLDTGGNQEEGEPDDDESPDENPDEGGQNDGGLDDDGSTDGDPDDDGTDQSRDEWRSFQRTPTNQGYAPTSLGDDLTERWTTDLDGGVTTQVALADGSVFAVTKTGTLWALDAATGGEEWFRPVDGLAPQCPAVVAGTVVVGTEAGAVVGFDVESGERQWTTTFDGAVGGVTPHAKTVYAGSSGGEVAAVDVATGDKEWTVDREPGPVTYPAATADALYVGRETPESREGLIAALDRTDSSERWTDEAFRMHAPTVAGRRVVATHLGVSFYNPDGYQRGQMSTNGHIYDSIAATPEAYVVVSQTLALAKERTDGGPDWTYFPSDPTDDLGPALAGPPTVTDSAVYLTVLPHEDERRLVALDRERGSERWSHTLGTETPGGPVVADDALFVGTEAGRLLAFD